MSNTQGSHSQISMTGGGGGCDRGSYFITKKITTSEFVYPKKFLSSFFATQKYPSVFFSRSKKIPASFIDPKKSPLAKISDAKKLLGLPPPPPPSFKICEWGPWGQTFKNIRYSRFFDMSRRGPRKLAIMKCNN